MTHPENVELPVDVRPGSNGLMFDHHAYNHRSTITVSFTPSTTLTIINVVQYEWGKEDTLPDPNKAPWFILTLGAPTRIEPDIDEARSVITQLWNQIEERLFKAQMGD